MIVTPKLIGDHLNLETRNRFLTADQAAEFLGGLNSRTVTRWAREGYMPSYPTWRRKTSALAFSCE